MTEMRNEMTLDDVVRLLAGTRLFAGLAREELSLFGKYIEGVRFEPGDVIVSERAEHEGIYIVLRGALEVVLPGAASSGRTSRTTDFTLATLKSGDCFGEYAIFDDKPASASVIGVRTGQIVRIAKLPFRDLLDRYDRVGKTIYHNLLNIMIDRQRSAGRDLDALLSDSRVAV